MQKEYAKHATCSRCKGTGMTTHRVVYAGVPGTCFKCAGTGYVSRKKYAAYLDAKAIVENALAWVAEYDRILENENERIEYFGGARAPRSLDHRWREVELVEKSIDDLRRSYAQALRTIREAEATLLFVETNWNK